MIQVERSITDPVLLWQVLTALFGNGSEANMRFVTTDGEKRVEHFVHLSKLERDGESGRSFKFQGREGTKEVHGYFKICAQKGEQNGVYISKTGS